MHPDAISVVGLSARFPGLESTPAFWCALRDGRRAVATSSPAQWADDPVFAGTGAYTRSAALFDDLSGFDWRAFKLSPKEAARLDPQQRLLLEQVAEALDVAGLPHPRLRGRNVGVYVAAMWDDFLRLHTRASDRIDGYTVSGATRAFLANRISFTFDFTGPSVTLDAACASSLVALHQAARALASGEIELAVVAGVSVILAPDSMGMMCAANVLSRDGVCRPLDLDGDGFVRTEGCCAVVLRRASEVEPGQRTFAHLVGSSVGHNGRSDWIMAANARAQARVLAEALARADKSREQLEYVELHGTGFARGDAVELQGIAEALAERQAEPCAVGTLKGNLGHGEAVAGLAGFIKVCLALAHGEVPGTIAPQRPNPVLRELEHVLRPAFAPVRLQHGVAAVTATSYGGTNAALVLEAGSPALACEPSSERAGPLLLLVSAADATTLQLALDDARLMLEQGVQSARDLCYAYARSRSGQPARVAVLAADRRELIEALRMARVPNEFVCSLDVVASGPMRVVALQFLAGESGEFCAQLDGRMAVLPARRYQRERLWPAGIVERRVELSVDAAVEQPPERAAEWLSDELAACHPIQRERLLVREIVLAMGRLLDLGESPLPAPDDAFFDVGMNSVSMVELRSWLQGALGRELAVSDLMTCATPRELARRLLTSAQLVERVIDARMPVALERHTDVEQRLLARLDQLGM